MLYLNGSKVVTSGSAVVFDGANMGIGVTPSAWSGFKALQVSNAMSLWSANGDNAYYSRNVYYDGSNRKYIFTGPASEYVQGGATHAWNIAASGTAGNTISFTQAMTLDAPGNLGLGATPSAWGGGIFKVFQLGGGGSNISATSGVDEQIQMLSNGYYDGSAYKYVISAHASRYVQNNSKHIWETAPSGTAGNSITFTEAMTLTETGSLQVGSTSAASPRILVYTNDNTDPAILARQDGTAPIQIWQAPGTERARITSGGNFLVGQTSTPSPLSAIAGIVTANLFAPTGSSTPTQVSGLVVIGGSTGSPNAGRVFFGDNTGWEWEWGYVNSSNTYARRFYFTDGGAAYSSTGTWGTISDGSLKQDISDSGSQWSDIQSIRFRKYRFKSDVLENQDAPYMLGVIAQELEQTSPGLVYTNKKGEKSVKTSVLLMKAASALQEAMTRIEQLEAKVAALEAN